MRGYRGFSLFLLWDWVECFGKRAIHAWVLGTPSLCLRIKGVHGMKDLQMRPGMLPPHAA